MRDLHKSIRPFLVVVGLVALGSCVVIAFFTCSAGGIVGITAFNQTQSYLQSQYGGSTTGWSLDLRDHKELSRRPEAGYYVFEFRYGSHSGFVTSSYREAEGKRVFDFKLSEKQ